MQLHIKNLIPHPLEEMQLNGQSLWKNGTYQFKPGSYYEVIASSGKGKTSLLDILFGRRNDYDGQYFIDNQNAKSINLNQWANLRTNEISYVFQGLRLFKHLTGWQNIEIKNRLTGTLSNNDILDLGEILQIKHQLSKRCGLMSYGQQQRLAIIRAFAQPFQWLLLDEPFSHLDPEIAKVAADLIKTVANKREAGVIITRLTNEEYLTTNQQIVL